MLKAIVAGLALAGLVMGTQTDCNGDKGKKTDPCQPNGCAIVKTEIGDGVWIVGDELLAGRWQSDNVLEGKKGCAWFVSPAANASPSSTSEPSFRDGTAGKVTITLHAGESFTTSGCGKWHKVG